MNIFFNSNQQILLAFREHIDKIHSVMIKTKDEEEIRDLYASIVNELAESLPAICSNNIDDVRKKLKEQTKLIIDRKIAAKELDVLSFNAEFPKCFFDSCEDLETKLYSITFPYALAGYQADDYYIEDTRCTEVCSKLNISKDTYIETVNSMGDKMFKYMVNNDFNFGDNESSEMPRKNGK